MQQGNYPRVTAGRNIVVEERSDGYRVSVRPDVVHSYRGFFLVRPYPNSSPQSPVLALQVVNGTLPYAESLTQPAGYVSIDRLHWIPEDKDGPGIGSRRLRFPVAPAASLSIPSGTNTVFLKITAHSGQIAGRITFREAENRTVFFDFEYLLAAELPELKEGVIYFPLAEVTRDGSGTFAVTQLCAGEPSGVIMNYYGSDTLDLSDSGESGSSSSSAPESSSSAAASSSSGASSSSAEASSSSEGPGSDSGDSSTASESSGGEESGSGSQPGESSSGDAPGESSSSNGGGGSGSGGGGVYDPDKWYIVADCIRYICHPSLGIENYSGTTNYYAAQGDKILFEPEPAAPTEGKPISEWFGVVMIQGPYDNRLDIPQARIDELNNLNVGDPC